MELKDILAARIRALMAARPDLDTQQKLSVATDMSQSTINRVLNRQVHTGLDVLATLAKVFGVDPTVLLTPLDYKTQKKVPILSASEKTILSHFRDLSDTDKTRVLAYMHIAKVSPTKGKAKAKTK